MLDIATIGVFSAMIWISLQRLLSLLGKRLTWRMICGIPCPIIENEGNGPCPEDIRVRDVEYKVWMGPDEGFINLADFETGFHGNAPRRNARYEDTFLGTLSGAYDFYLGSDELLDDA
jgi:hypothetical protein